MFSLLNKFCNKYFRIPINQELGGSDLALSDAMNEVARAKGYRNAKSYLKAVLGCSGNSVKNMIRAKPSTRTESWSLDEHPTKDAYSYIRKLDREKYAKVVNLIISEYIKIISKSKRNSLLESLKIYKITSESYQWALCYKSIDGLKTAIFDPGTSIRINNTEVAKNIAECSYNELFKEENIILP